MIGNATLRLAAAAAAMLAVPGPAAAADQSFRLGEFTATIPAGCTPEARKARDSATLTCAYAPKDGAARTYTLTVRTSRNETLLTGAEGLSPESRGRMLRASLPSYLYTYLSFGLPPVEAQPPKGYTVDRWTVGGDPEPGPGGITGWCAPFAYHAVSTRDAMDAQGLACAVALANGRDLAVLASTLSVTHAAKAGPPADFPKAAQRIAGSVRHRPG